MRLLKFSCLHVHANRKRRFCCLDVLKNTWLTTPRTGSCSLPPLNPSSVPALASSSGLQSRSCTQPPSLPARCHLPRVCAGNIKDPANTHTKVAGGSRVPEGARQKHTTHTPASCRKWKKKNNLPQHLQPPRWEEKSSSGSCQVRRFSALCVCVF